MILDSVRTENKNCLQDINKEPSGEQKEMSDTEDVFTQLKEASESVSKGLETILKLAPDRKLYDTLLDSASNPFLKGLLMKGKDSNIDLEDNGIKFAVSVKELYDSGYLDILKVLSDGDVSKLESWSSSHSKDEGVTGCTKKSGDDEHGNDVSISLDTAGNDLGDEKDQKHDRTATESEDYSELFTEASLMQVDTSGKGYRYDEYDFTKLPNSVFKRERKFEVCTKDNLPELPPITDHELKAKIFTHSSVLSSLNIPEEKKIASNNERIEFLGDAFLQFITSMIIYERFPHFSEGQLSILRSKIVSNDKLFKMSQYYGFDKQLRKNFNDSSILNNKIYSDVFEAYLGAINEEYMLESIDGETNVSRFMKGWFMAKEWVEKLCEDELRGFDPSIVFKMQYSKSSKQELRLLLGLTNVPEYVRCNISGKKFLSCVKVNHKVYGYGIGTSHKEADSRAATDALSNPGIKKICMEDVWEKFEDGFGLDEKGGLNFEQYPTVINAQQLEMLKKEIAMKFKTGDIKMLASRNNPKVLLVGEKDRELAALEIIAKHSITNTLGELNIEEKSSRESTPKSSGKNKTSKTELEKKAKEDREKYPPSEYYGKEFTMGRGGVFGEEYYRLAKGTCKRKGGMVRNGQYEIVEVDAESGRVLHTTKKIMCHEVLESCNDVDLDSRNRVNSLFNKRGSSPGYTVYTTTNEEFLCELWFGSEQIVGYGLDRNKKTAAQKAAMLALKREEFYADAEDAEDEEDEEDESESDTDSDSNSDSDRE